MAKKDSGQVKKSFKRAAYLLIFIFLSCEKDRIASNNEDISRWKTGFDKVKIIPTIQAKDLRNILYSSQDFIGHYVYIQFIKKGEDIQSYLELWREYTNYSTLKIILFAEDARSFGAGIPDQCIQIIADYKSFESLFSIPACCSEYFLYDNTGRLVKSGPTLENESGVRKLLRERIKNIYIDYGKILSIKTNGGSASLVDQIYTSRPSKLENGFYMAALLTNICSSCLSGKIVMNFNSISAKYPKMASSMSILIKGHTDSEIESIKKHFNIKYSILKASEETENTWNRLIKEYSENELTDIVIVFDNTGNIIDIMEPYCACLNEFVKRSLKRIDESN